MDKCVINTTRLELVEGDITHEATDAIANAANCGLRGGGGVDGAIHNAGGPAIMAECRRIGRCETGDAVITGAGDLPAKHVIHTAGPVWHGGGKGEAKALASCYRRSLEVALENGLASIAFPSVSTGVYGYPLEEAAGVALSTVSDFLLEHEGLELVRFVLYDSRTYQAYSDALAELLA
ncbi:MAG: O-acetyl-ADP-ribose deacetylase [Planctomycetes bacterium]|nr:O-acetyl-ADP-ribose deacetylase [Planctomycetota bacterium]